MLNRLQIISLINIFSVLINLDHVGDFGDRPGDVVCLGKCDDVVRELARELGWEQELQEAWEATAGSVESDTADSPATNPSSTAKVKERLQAEVDKLTDDMEKSLSLNSNAGGRGKPEVAHNTATCPFCH